MFPNDATVHPWGEEKKKTSLWRRVFKRSKPKPQEYVPSAYTPSPFSPSTFERNTAYGVPAYQVPKSRPYSMYSASNSSDDPFYQVQPSNFWTSPPQSPISSQSLASSRSSHSSSRPPPITRLNTGHSSTTSFMPCLEEEQLVLTLTSKYPTGVAADLYVPETTVLPEDNSLGRSISTRSYQAKHAIKRTYSRHTARGAQNRQSWHF